jgi:hypothetical protein
MLMEPDDARDQRLAGEVDGERAGRDLDGAIVADRGDLAVANDDCLIRSRRCARAVDDAR